MSAQWILVQDVAVVVASFVVVYSRKCKVVSSRMSRGLSSKFAGKAQGRRIVVAAPASCRIANFLVASTLKY